MQQHYSETTEKCELVQARPETISFLMAYSRSLSIINADGMVFENNLN